MATTEYLIFSKSSIIDSDIRPHLRITAFHSFDKYSLSTHIIPSNEEFIFKEFIDYCKGQAFQPKR